jgi:GDP-4-dehydro-6-deoxy-D-mannose reductase
MDEAFRNVHMKGRNILITGAAGFTGRHAVAYFAEKGASVTAVLRQPFKPDSTVPGQPVFPQGVEIYICDLSDRKAVAEMVAKTAPEEVLHLAGKNSVPESWQDPLLYMETNVMATLYLLEALRAQPSSRILVAGSRLKYRIGSVQPPHPYSLSKTLEELVSLAWRTLFKQQVMLAEPCNLMGPGNSAGFCSLLAGHIVRSESGMAQAPFKLSSRWARRDFLDVRDAVRAYDLILRTGEIGQIYRIESGVERRLGDIAEQLLKRSMVPVPMEWGADVAEPVLSPVPAGTGKPPTDSSAPERDAVELGWQARIPLEQSLSDIIDYFRMGREGGLS